MTLFSKITKKFIAPLAGSVAIATSGMGNADASPEAGAPPETINGVSLSDYLGSEEYWEKLTRYIIGYERMVGPCKTPVINRRLHAQPANPPLSVPGVGVVPQWVETLLVEGCEEPFERRVATFYMNDQPGFLPYVLGNPTADPFLQRDVINAIVPHARSLVKDHGDSPDVRVIRSQTTDVSREENGLKWLEQWTLQAPDNILEFRVKFTQTHGEGTTFHITQQ